MVRVSSPPIQTSNGGITPGTIFSKHHQRVPTPSGVDGTGVWSVPKDVRGGRAKDKDSVVANRMEGV